MPHYELGVGVSLCEEAQEKGRAKKPGLGLSVSIMDSALQAFHIMSLSIFDDGAGHDKKLEVLFRSQWSVEEGHFVNIPSP